MNSKVNLLSVVSSSSRGGDHQNSVLVDVGLSNNNNNNKNDSKTDKRHQQQAAAAAAPPLRSGRRSSRSAAAGVVSSICPCLHLRTLSISSISAPAAAVESSHDASESVAADDSDVNTVNRTTAAACNVACCYEKRQRTTMNTDEANNISQSETQKDEQYRLKIHTQVEYTHCLVPDLTCITNSPYYWGIMDRFEAEKLLENKSEGAFLLRDSAQTDYLFSVSFRRYKRTLHARVEHLNHKFSFDSYDPMIYNADTVTDLIKRYDDPTKCLFFEPMLTRPLMRNFPFPLRNLCRSVICDRISYDNVQYLKVPRTLKQFLREYHYKQSVRVRQFD